MTRRRQPTGVVSFRATVDLLRQIDAARKKLDVSRGEWVRGIVTAHLYQGDHIGEILLDALNQLTQDVQNIDQSIWKAVLVQLVHGAGLHPADAKDILQKLGRE